MSIHDMGIKIINKIRYLTLLILCLTMFIGFMPKVEGTDRTDVYIEPALSTSSRPFLSVIVTGEDMAAAAEAIHAVGGEVTSRLWLIDGVGATIPASELDQLASLPGVQSIVHNKSVFTANTFPIETPYSEEGWVTERRRNLYQGDVTLEGTLSTPPVLLPDGGVFTILQSGKVLVLNAEGTERGRNRVYDSPYEDPPVVHSDGTIFVNGMRNLHAFNPDGSMKWEKTYPAYGKITGGLALDAGSNLLYVVAENQYILGIDPANGALKDSIDLGDHGNYLAPPTVDADGNLYAVSELGFLSKVYTDTELTGPWTFQLPGDPYFDLSPQIGPDGRIYVPSREGRVTAVNPDGSESYSFYQAGVIQEPVAIASDGSVYAAYGDQLVLGINPTGSPLFDFVYPGHSFLTSPVLTEDENQVVAASYEGKVFALDAASGSKNWDYEVTQDAEIEDNPVVGPHGNLHIADGRGTYHILNPGKVPLYKNNRFTKFFDSPTIAPDGTIYLHDYQSVMITLTRLPDEWDGVTPDVLPTEDPSVYRLLNPISIDMGADILHEQGIDGSGVTVAVLDSGVYFDNKVQTVLGLVVRDHFLGQADFVLNEQECSDISGTWHPSEDYCQTDSSNSIDEFGHGTHVAGIIWNNMRDYYTGVTLGVAPDANIVSVRVLGENGGGSYEDVIQGIQYVVDHKDSYSAPIRVLNLSLSALPTTPYFADPLNIAVEKAWAAGIVVMAAAGNIGPQAETITVPGNNPYVVTVGAIDSKRTPGYWGVDSIPGWSAAGPTYDGFFKPDILAPGMNVVSFMHNGDEDIPFLVRNHPDYSEDTTLFRMNGTSMATAAASGVVALMLENDPSLTPDQVKFILSYTGQQFVNQYGEVLDSIFHQGAGRIWSPAAVYGDYPPEGHANVGMDIVADYTHGWETEEELGYHYEGPVIKLLSDDGGVYLYYMEGIDGSLMALGATDKVKTLFQTADDLDELADLQPSGQMVWAGGEIKWADGQMAWTGGPIVWVGGQRAPDGTEKTWSGGQMVWAGGQMVWAGGQMVWAGRPNIGDSNSTSPALGPIVETPVPNDWQWLEAELVWSGDQINWIGGEMVWEPGQVLWDGGTLDPNFTFSYADHWVNDDGTVEEIVESSVVFVPLFLK